VKKWRRILHGIFHFVVNVAPVIKGRRLAEITVKTSSPNLPFPPIDLTKKNNKKKRKWMILKTSWGGEVGKVGGGRIFHGVSHFASPSPT
jgi:hypothetical protein